MQPFIDVQIMLNQRHITVYVSGLRIDYGDDRVVGSGFTKTGISQL